MELRLVYKSTYLRSVDQHYSKNCVWSWILTHLTSLEWSHPSILFRDGMKVINHSSFNVSLDRSDLGIWSEDAATV